MNLIEASRIERTLCGGMFVTLLALLGLGLGLIMPRAEAAMPFEAQAFVKTYCVECHGADKQKGDRRFDELDPALPDLHSLESWQEVLDQLNLAEMPPERADQPTSEERLAAVAWITEQVEEARTRLAGASGEPRLRRLNRYEYDQTVRSLLALEPMLLDASEGFPADITHHHLDNNAGALVTSDFLLQAYLDSARELVERATDPAERPKVQKWSFRAPFSRRAARPDGLDVPGKHQHLRSNNSYERGFIYLGKFMEGVPVSGRYKIRFKAQGLFRDYPYPESKLHVSKTDPLRVGVVAGHPAYGELDSSNGGDRVLGEFDLPDAAPKWFSLDAWLDQGYQPRFTFPNGPYRTKPLRGFTVSEYPDHFPEFLSKYVRPGDNEFRKLPKDRYNPKLHGTDVAERGDRSKVDATAFYVSKNSSEGWRSWTRGYQGPRVRLFEVEIEGPFIKEWPTRSHVALHGSSAEGTEPRSVIARFATKAFRRPVTKPELDSLVALVETRRSLGESAEVALRSAFQAVLCSPSFLYLAQGPEPHAIASRLSYFLWSGPPDEALLAADLSQPTALRGEMLRLLADPRSAAFSERFPDRWLGLFKLGTQPPDHAKNPRYFNQGLEAAMRTETERFFDHVLDQNLPIDRFLDADFTFLNAALARHYQLDGVSGHHFRRVTLEGRRRGGVLTQASVLTASANGIDTSPVLRGVWVLENVLGTPPSPPPPDIEPIEPDIRGATTIRDQLEKHRDVATCAECHRKIDPLGFALENYDAVGAWRDRYPAGKKKVDPSGTMPDGTAFANVGELKNVMLERDDQFARCLTEKLLAYATGREMKALDRPEIDQILADLDKAGGGLRDLVELIVTSKIFREG